MMQANELRIGNLITRNNRIFEIETIDSFYKWVGTKDQDYKISLIDIQPIELTEEWLIKAGFETFCGIWYHKGINNQLLVKKYKECLILYYKNKSIVKLDSVHEFQNMHWCLTGEELKIKL